jgi:hypothetical protein
VIVHHAAGEGIAGFMSRQYRPWFNVFAPIGGLASGLAVNVFVWDWIGGLVALAALVGVAGVNVRGYHFRVKPQPLRKPTKLVCDWLLELQDIYFRVPNDLKPTIGSLLEGAYSNVRSGAYENINPRLEKARELKREIVLEAARLDSKADMEVADDVLRSMRQALPPGHSGR